MEGPEIEISAHDLSELFKNYMKETGKSLRKISEESGISRATLRRVLNNSTYDPQFETTMKKLYSYMNYKLIRVPIE